MAQGTLDSRTLEYVDVEMFPWKNWVDLQRSSTPLIAVPLSPWHDCRNGAAPPGSDRKIHPLA